MKYKTIAAIFIGLVQASFQTASAQCGDSCITATPLIVDTNGICIYDSCTTIGATPSGVGTLPCSGVSNNDVWYTFTVPAGVTNLIAQVQGSATGMNYPIIYAYRDSCISLLSLGCNSGSPPASLAALNMTSLIPGEQIWIRVKAIGGTQDGTFQICVFDPCPTGPPLNDNPCSATVVPMAGSCAGYTSLTNYCAGNSPGVPSPGCGNYQGGDIWAQLTVPASGNLHISFEHQTIQDVACAVYSGPCSSLTLRACDDDNGAGLLPYLNLTGLVPFDTLWIRVWSVGGGDVGSIGICLRDDCPSGAPPSNDNPCSATSIPLTTPCSSFVTVSNICATGTSVAAPNCTGYIDDDVWVKTTVGTSGSIEVLFLEQTLSNVGAALYRGTCSSLVYMDCDDNGGPGDMPRLFYSGLTPGIDVWIRIWDHSGGDTGTVGVCITEPCIMDSVMYPLLDNPPCPFPDSAVSFIPVNYGPCTGFTIYTSDCADLVFGNTPTGIPMPSGCSPTWPPASATGWDVWATFIVPDTLATDTLNIQTVAGTIIDLDMAVYSVASPVDSFCNDGSMYTMVTCDELSGVGFMPFIQLPFGGSNPVQPGDTMLLRMWKYFGGPTGNWSLCLNIAAPMVIGVEETPGRIQDFTIRPNPMSQAVQISFILEGFQKTRVIVYDIAGREIKQLMSTTATGRQELTWDRTDDYSKPVAGGAYFIGLETGNFSATKKVVVLP